MREEYTYMYNRPYLHRLCVEDYSMITRLKSLLIYFT